MQPIDCQVWRDTVTARVRLCGQAGEGLDKFETESAFPVGLKSIYPVQSNGDALTAVRVRHTSESR